MPVAGGSNLGNFCIGIVIWAQQLSQVNVAVSHDVAVCLGCNKLEA